jgi:hypothetical protein
VWLQFLAGLAWRDLTDRTGRRATAVVVFTVAAAVAFALVGFGFTYGVRRVQEAKLKEDPLNLCVWAGSTGYRAQLTDGDVAAVRAAAQVDGARIRAVAAFRHVSLRVQVPEGQSILDGRTVKLGPAGDLLFDGRPVRPGPNPTDPSTRGLFITIGLLRRLGLPEAPPTLNAVFGSNRAEPIPVVGVIDNLPFDRQFVVTEAFAAELARRDSDVVTATAFSGPIGADWPADWDWNDLEGKLPQAVRARLAKDGCRIHWQSGPGPGAWIFSLADGSKRFGEWFDLMTEVAQLMRAAGWAAAPNFAAPELRDAPGLRADRADYDMVAVYVDDLKSIAPVTDAVGSLRMHGEEALPVDREIAKRVQKIGEQTSRAEGAMGVVSGLVALLAGAVAFAILRLRAEHQVAEIGMLQAMGMSRLSLVVMAGLQGLYVWAAGAGIGTAVGLWGVGLIARVLPDGDPTLGAYRELWLVGTIASAALPVCVASAWWAGIPARRLSPAEGLGAAL